MTHLPVLILLWLGHFLVDFMLGIWPVFKTLSLLDLGMAGIIVSGCAFLGEGSQLVFGKLSDAGYRKRLIAIGLLLTVANGFLAFTHSYALLFFILLLTCIGSGAFHPAAAAYVSSLTDRQKGLYIAFFASGGAFGMAFSQSIYSHFYSYSENHTFLTIIPAILLVIVLALYGFFKKEALAPSQAPSIGFDIFKKYFRDHALRRLYITQVCNQTILWGSIFLLPDLLLARKYDASITFGGGHMAFIMGSALMMIPSGYLADRYSPRLILVISSFCGMLFYFALLTMPFLPSAYLIPLLIVSGAFLGIIQPIAVALATDLGKQNPGAVSAFTMGLVWCVSETLGPAGAGLLTKLFADDAPAKALMVLGALFPLQIFAAYGLTRRAEERKLA